MFRFAVKSLVAGEAVYLSVNEGIWDGPERSVEIYQNVYVAGESLVKDLVKGADIQIPEIPDVPQPSQVISAIPKYWNSGVKHTFNFLNNSPELLSTYANQATTLIMESMDNLNEKKS